MEHDLGPDPVHGLDRRLVALDPGSAAELGAVFAAISPWAEYPYPAAALAAYFAGSTTDAPRYQIMLGKDSVGVAGVRNEWLRGPYLQFLGVFPDFQRHGLGAAVLTWFEREARASRQRNLWVAASDFNASAIRFYERHGFVEVARLEGLVTDGHAEVLLRKQLT
ncbi:MAG: GNAT family N-acetyltransferase [Hyphomicrobium sp.]